MILRNATIKYKGYDPYTLSKGSNKRICVSCDQCGKVRWLPYYAYRDICSLCSHNSKNINKNSKITKICIQCYKKFIIYPTFKNQKFCSQKCYGIYKSENFNGELNSNWKGGDITLVCKQCGEKFKVELSRNDAKFCSRECMGEWHSINDIGDKSSNWKGGIANDHSHLLTEQACIKLNNRFEGSHFHHIMRGVGIYLPKDLHQSIWHDLKNNKNMIEINELTLNYLIRGEL